jgi:rare lipoprotein A
VIRLEVQLWADEPGHTTPGGVHASPAAPARPTLLQSVVLTATVAAVAVGAFAATGVDGAPISGTTGPRIAEADPPATAAVPVAAPSPPPAASFDAPAASLPATPFSTRTTAAATGASTPTAARPGARSRRSTRSPRGTVTRRNGTARGGASWYASPFGSDSCASRTLRFGTIVRITNLSTGAMTTCRVADRGPVARSRVLDLDNDVFRRLAPVGVGVIPVHITW